MERNINPYRNISSRRRISETESEGTTSNSTNVRSFGRNSSYNNRGNCQFTQRQHGKRFYGFKYIESLLKLPLDEILSKLNGNEDFFQFLQKDLSTDLIILIVQLIKKCCDCDFSSIRLRILQKSMNTNFLKTIQTYILAIPFQSIDEKRRNTCFWINPENFWNCLCIICKTLLKEMPQLFSEPLSKILKIICLNLPIIESNHNIHISDEIKENYKHLVQMSENVLIELENKEKKTMFVDKDEGEPPDDFREISVYPTSFELLGNMKPFLRKNVIKGPYRDIEHYLDVQFRLLREDFVGPLRDGINAYLTNDKAKNYDVKIHKRVQFLNPVTETEHYCALLKFNFNKKKKSFTYENSRRLMYGSLVCFTRDHFENLIFGKIVKREEKSLENGEITIGFDSNEPILYNVDYVMIECGVYFEPYYHVLTVMQQMSEDMFPLQNFIIDVDTSNNHSSYFPLGTNISIKNRPFLCEPSQLNRIISFNDSQRNAFLAALTRKFSVIQGPPGTGKTYLGLRIARTFLENYEKWYSESPMLIICYTNHALDQFLEGILKYTKKVVRIGGQSKNEKLNDYNLRQFSSTFKMSESFYHSKTKVKELLKEVKGITETLKSIKNYNCIFNFHDFSEIIKNYRNSWLPIASNDDLLDWLFGNEKQDFKNKAKIYETTNDYYFETDEYETVDEYEANKNDISDDFEDLLNEVDEDPIEISEPLLDLCHLEKYLRDSEKELHLLQNEVIEEETYDQFLKRYNLQMQLSQYKDIYYLCKEKLDMAKKGIRIKPEVKNVRKSMNISIDQRWNLYFYWLDLYNIHLIERYEKMNEKFRLHYKIFSEAKELEDIKILKETLVVGMTTTSAARLHSSLQMLKSPIVIVEEAAEVLEAHVVTSLTKHCQQLILIGDHQQLKPSTSNYQIEKFYNLGISLFERMILNNVECFTLSTQHRMRPEISSLIKPHIYPNLQDHESVLNRPQIKGVTKSVYFIDHKYPENEEDDSGTTKKNMHEAKFLIQLAKYLVLNGYKPSQITILAAYLGQMFEMKKEKSEYIQLREMKITVLDNYQGEESDIILLSLVRNNPDKKVGFLSIENRICVALSRARNGLYIMGNMSHLCERSDIWCRVKETLENQDSLGNSLTLKCQIHEKITEVSVADDFMSVVEGGCDTICGAPLNCNHNCNNLCHILDREHLYYECQETCNKLLCNTDPSHICLKLCYENCGLCDYPIRKLLKCDHEAVVQCHMDENDYNCLVEVQVTLLCGHETKKPCYMELKKHECSFKCDTRLECGHSCTKTCHIFADPDHIKYKCLKRCPKPPLDCQNPDEPDHLCKKLCYEDCVKCDIPMQKERKCGHLFKVPCSSNVDDIKCEKSCKIQLPCGHKCKSGCDNPCGPCNTQVEKVVPDCNHIVNLPCNMEAKKEHCLGKCTRMMSCGHLCVRRCKEKCESTNCKEIVDVAIPSKCGHIIKKIPCFIKILYETSGEQAVGNLEKYCTEPCTEFLNCSPDTKHMCTGTCSECFQGRIHKRCAEKCGRILVCNHECEVSCRETCKPCQKPCSYKCKHSACKKKCGEPCTKCNEPCNRRCVHQCCKFVCGKICSVPPCKIPCDKKIEKCGHPCIGFCGDPCPTLCRICDKEVLEELFFGTEDKEDARFVLLNDCGHILENSGMELWLTQDENEIKFKVCPKCKTTIYTTERYSDYIKRAVEDIEKVKNKQSGTNNDVLIKRNEIKTRLEEILGTIAVTSSQSRFFNIISANINVIYSRLFETNKKGRKQQINLVELNSIEIKSKLIENINEILKKHGNIPNISNLVDKQINFILKSLLREVDDITTTEIDDIQREITRLERILLFEKLKNTPQGLTKATNPEVQNLYEKISKHLFSLFKYKKEIDETVEVYLKDLDKLLKTFIGVTEIEKAQIVKAIGLAKGHWYKCPNGHPYAIGECGGAMQVSTCIECKAPIGGQSHRLIHNNAVATEMDGATYGAWSEGANMGNYML